MTTKEIMTVWVKEGAGKFPCPVAIIFESEGKYFYRSPLIPRYRKKFWSSPEDTLNDIVARFISEKDPFGYILDRTEAKISFEMEANIDA